MCVSAPKSKIKWAGYNSNNSKEIKQATFQFEIYIFICMILMQCEQRFQRCCRWVDQVFLSFMFNSTAKPLKTCDTVLNAKKHNQSHQSYLVKKFMNKCTKQSKSNTAEGLRHNQRGLTSNSHYSCQDFMHIKCTCHTKHNKRQHSDQSWQQK